MANYEVLIRINGMVGTGNASTNMYSGIFEVNANNYHLITEAISDVLHMRFDSRIVGGKDVHASNSDKNSRK